MMLRHVQGYAAKQGKDLCRFSIPNPADIFPVRHNQYPVLLILCVPMLANAFGDLTPIEYRRMQTQPEISRNGWH